MVWYAGNGAVRVLESDGPAVPLERPRGNQSLLEMSQRGGDDEATRILCGTAERLHAKRDREIPPHLLSLEVWFRALTLSQHPPIRRACTESGDSITQISSAILILKRPLHPVASLAAPRSWRERPDSIWDVC